MNKIKLLILFVAMSSLSACNDDKKEDVAKQIIQPASQVVAQQSTPPTDAFDGFSPTTPPASKPAATNGSNQATDARKLSFAQTNPTSSNLALALYSQGLLAYSETAYNEGYRNTFYHDNSGVAIAFGLNASYQTKSNATFLAKDVLQEPSKSAFISQAHVMDMLPSSKVVNIPPDEGVLLLQKMTNQYEMPAVKVFCPKAQKPTDCAIYENLPDNAKAVMFYHDYNTGGFSKFPHLAASIRAWANNPNQASKDNVKSQLTYTYKLKGQIIHNTHEDAIQQAMWEGKEWYYAIITKNPHSISSSIDIASINKIIPALKDQPLIDASKPIDPQIADPIGIYKQEQNEKDEALELELDSVGSDKASAAPIAVAPAPSQGKGFANMF